MFSATKKMKKLYCVIYGKYKKFKKPKISHNLSVKIKMKKYLKKENQFRY